MAVQSPLSQKEEKIHEAQDKTSSAKLKLARFFTKEGVHPYSEVYWEKRTVEIYGRNGKITQDKDLEFPDFWSQNAVNITASKYFRGKRGTTQRETSLKQVINRVAKTIRSWGEQFGYFESAKDAEIFEEELIHLILYQKAAFNSPVWFNVGLEAKPQCSACFILSVQDDMESILEWIRTEGLIFKKGSGSGINLSTLRSSHETLSSGGHSSGPVAFMRGADAVAGMIKSGGATRRAAKMVVLNVDHPDIVEFIRAKAEEEKKIRALMAAGYEMQDLNNEAWYSIQYQNANNSVRVTDEFMQAVEENKDWHTHYVKTGEIVETFKAKDILQMIAQAAWECGDPGLQYDTTINDWHTCPNSGRINASNPCSEYMHLDNSACNLASINLLKFLRPDGTFMVDDFKKAVDIIALAQEIIVGGSSYPTEKIAKNAHDFRELGLGFANLGALLMAKGLAYDSDTSRAIASAVTALMSGEGYKMSAKIAGVVGPFAGFKLNEEPMLRVIEKHRAATDFIKYDLIDDKELYEQAKKVWEEALELGKKNGFRNSQISVIAPTGTIALMMDCDTTGVEPDFSLVKIKQLVGGGTMKIINNVVPVTLKRLGYKGDEVKDILVWIEEKGTIEGAPYLKDEHLPVFDCAVRPQGGQRSISWQGHVKMVAAVQPFISGSISKTFNMPNDATPEEITDAFVMGWRLGLKSFAVYRDGAKAAQPLQTKSGKGGQEKLALIAGPMRRRLPPTRVSETHKFVIAGHEGYLTYSVYEDGSLAELFIRMAKQGSTLAGLLDSFAIVFSMALQYGVPLKDILRKFIYSRFEPAGVTENPDIRIATSITDYISRYLAIRFLVEEDLLELGIVSPQHPIKIEKVEIQEMLKTNGNNKGKESENHNIKANVSFANTVCRLCGGMMIQTGSCMTCIQCGESSGGC